MNKRNLALLISKHPLLRKLTEDKTIPNNVVARLIVEELMEAQTGLLKSALGGIRRDFNQNKQGKYIDADTRKPVYPYGRLNELDEEEQTKYKDAVNKKVQAFLAKQNPETKAQGEKIEKQVDAAIDKEIGTPQDTEQQKLGERIVDNIFNSSDLSEYLNNYANGVDIFAVKYPEYYEKRKLQPKEYAANFKKEIKSLINDKQYLAMFKDESKRKDLTNAIRSIYEPKISSFGTKNGREDLMKRLVPLIFEYWETPQDTKQKDETFNSLDIPKYGNIIELALKEYENIPIEELDDDAKLVVALTHRYFDNRAMEEQIDPKKIFLGALGKMVGATEELPSKTYEDFKTFLDYAGKEIKGKEYQDGNFFKILSSVMEHTEVRSGVQQYITGSKPLQSDKNPLAPPAQKIVDNIASVVVDIDAKEEFLKTYKQNNLPLTLDLVLDRLPEEQVDVLNTAPEEKKEEIVKAVADELERDQQKNPFKGLEGYSELNLKPPEEKVFVQFLTKLQEAKIINEENLVQLSKIVGTGRGLSKIIKSFELPERKILIVVLQRVEVQKFIQNNLQQIEKPQEPGEEEKPSSTTDPEVFDPEAEDLETLIATSKALIDEFYDKDFLQEQGILINAVLKQLAKIVEKEEQEKAARRSKKPEQSTQELQEQDQEPFNEKERTKIQIDLKSFLRLIKKAKAVLKKFDDLRNKGSIASSGYKKDFIKILVQLQGNIKTLVEDLTPYMNLTEAVEKSDLQKKWDAIEVGYEEATKYLSNIIQAGTETQENFDMENNVKGAYGALMSITGYFPSVNPFGAKTTSGFDEYENNFNEAVDEVKGTIRDILEVTKGTIGRTATQNAIQGLKTFSGQIQNIFGEEARSTFSDVVIKPNAPAAQGDTKEIPVIEPFANRGILKLPPPEKLSDEQKQQLQNFEEEEEDDEELIKKAAQVFVGTKSIETETLTPVQKTIAATEVRELAKDVENPTANNFETYDRYMGSRIPESFGLKEEQKETLRFFKYFQSKQKKINEQDEGTVVGNKIAEDETLLPIVNEFLKQHRNFEDTWNSIMQTTNAYTTEVTKEFLNYLKEPIKFSRARPIPPRSTKKINKKEPEAEEPDEDEEVVAQELEPDNSEKEELSLEEKVKFLDKMRGEIVLKSEAGDKDYQITDFEADLFGGINVEYKDGNDKEDMLTASEDSIEELYKLYKAKEFAAVINISDKDGKVLPFLFKLIKPYGSFDEKTGDSLSERIEKLIKPLIKEMLTKGNKK